MGIPGIANSYFLLQAIEGLRNGRVIAVLIISFVVSYAILLFGAVTGFQYGLYVVQLVASLVLCFGISCAGLMLMDAARGLPTPSFRGALAGGVLGLAKFLALVLLLIACAGLYWIAMASILFVCKIPGVGPVLYAIVFPVLSVITAFVIATAFAAFGLMFPAIWEGQTIGGAIAQILTIGRQKPSYVLMHLIALLILIALTSSIIYAFFGAALMSIARTSIAVIGISPDIFILYSQIDVFRILFVDLPAPANITGDMGAYSIALAISMIIVIGVVFAPLWSMALMGINLIYLQVSQGIDASEAEAALQQRFAQAKRKAEEMQERARRAAEQRHVAGQPASAPPSASGSTMQPGLRCPGCSVAITANDAFCGECGYKMK